MNGDAALATGWDLVLPNDDIRMAFDEINKTRDYAATYQRNTMPPRFEGRFRRSDGAQAINAGTTLMRWEGTPTDTLGGEATAGPNGATYVLAAGVYMVTATLKLSVEAQNYSQLIISGTGFSILSSDEGEWQTPPGFYEMGGTRLIHVAETALVWVYTLSNNAGVIRTDGYFRVVKL